MPPSLIRRALGPLIGGIVGVAERAIELIGDPDLRESIERDRRALDLCHRRLVEAYAEIEELEGVLKTTTGQCADLSNELRKRDLIIVRLSSYGV